MTGVVPGGSGKGQGTRAVGAEERISDKEAEKLAKKSTVNGVLTTGRGSSHRGSVVNKPD